MDKKRVSVFVAGQQFTILTDEDEKYVIDVAAKIDARIASLSFGQNMTRERAAVLTAMDFADDNEQDKRALAEIREQIKDYVTEISRLSEENAALNEEIKQFKQQQEQKADEKSELDAQIKQLNDKVAQISDENTALNAENLQLKSKIDALKEAESDRAADDKEKEALKEQLRALQEELEAAKAEAAVKATPVIEAAPAEKDTFSAEDDLFFDVPEEPAVKAQKDKKNKHEHQHVNPYKQQFMQKKNDQKGYTQQRQYSLFDDNE